VAAPKRVVALVACVDLLAVLLLAVGLVLVRVSTTDLLRLGLLALFGGLYLEVSRRVERSRRLFAAPNASIINMTSVWILAGAVVLPRGLAAVLVVFLYGHLWIRSWRTVDGVRLHRVVYSAAGVILSSFSVSVVVPLAEAHRTLSTFRPIQLLTLALAIVVFWVSNTMLVSAAIVTSRGWSNPSTLLGTVSDNAVEFATLALGAVTAVSLVRVPWFAVMVLPAVFLLQYHALLRDLVQAATVDAKTELLNAGAWRQLAQRELGRGDRQETSTAVLVIDMDRFKHINDTYGHLAGDTALRAVADALADELREYDAVGRFGGEEFVALLPGADTHAAVNVAERLRRRIEATEILVEGRNAPGTQRVHVTASVGVASAPAKAADLDDLLRAADDALYAAKHGGRNTVRVAPSAVAA